MSLFTPRRAVIEALGRMVNQLGGGLLTRLTAPLAPTDTSAQVESTYGFPATGAAAVGGELFAYGGTGVGALLELDREADDARLHAAGEVVALYTGDGRAAWSDLDRAWAMVFVDTAEGPYLDVLGRGYGVLRFAGINDTIYRGLIKIMAYQPGRGTKQAIGDFLDVIEVCPAPLSGTGDLDRGERTLTVDGAEFSSTWAGVRLRLGGEGRNARTVRVRSVVAPDTLALDPLSGWSHLGADLDDAEDVPWTVVPWDILEPAGELGIARIRINCREPEDLEGVGYLHLEELGTVVDVDTVQVEHPIRQVLGVWLANDPRREGTNYADDNAFAGDVITLSTSLPDPGVEVLVDYGSIATPDAPPTTGLPGDAGPPATGQVFDLPAANTGDRYPIYLGDRLALLRAFLPRLTVSGIFPELKMRLLTL